MKVKHWFNWSKILYPQELLQGLARIFLTLVARYNPQYLPKLREKFKGCRYNFTLEKIKWLEDTKIIAYTATDVSVAYQGIYEPHELNFIKNTLKEGDIFIDVGANIGLYTVVASKFVGKSGTVFSFEPSTREYELLVKNINLNRLNNVKLFKLALSNYDGEASFYVGGCGRTGANTLSNKFRSKSHVIVERIEKIKVNKMDTFFNDINIPKITLIKIDVEGHDYYVIEGAQKILQKYKPIIIIEILEEGLKIAGSSSIQIFSLLKSLNYKFLFFPEESGTPKNIPDYLSLPKIVCYNLICIPNN